MIGDRIRRLRKYKGLTTRELASDAGITQAMVYKYENGKATPRKKALGKLAKALGTTVKVLMQVEAEPSRSGFDQTRYELLLAEAKSFEAADKQVIFHLIETLSRYNRAKKTLNG